MNQYPKDTKKYRIVNYVNGKYGYKNYWELQLYNTVYNCFGVVHDALELQFIESWCIMEGLDYKSIQIVFTLDK
jgi:hypothetical protein